MQKVENIKKVNLNANEFQELTIYNDGKLAFISNLKDIDVSSMVQTEIYVIALVLEGKAQVNINGTTYVAYKNDIFICPPNNIIESSLSSVDFQCQCIGMSREYIHKLLPMADNIWDIKLLFEKNPVFTLSPNEVTVWKQYYDLLCSKVHLPSVVQEKVINLLMLAFFYDMQNHLSRVIQLPSRSYTSGECLFKKFIDLLETSYPKNREVSYYADRLNVTPKYLSSICKAASMQTASSLIDQYVLKDVEYLLKYSSKTIKEIVNELDFPNISFFGRYVKKHLGMPPRALREKFCQEYNQNTIHNL